jgi:putative ABC transport system permease protein
VTPAGFVFVYEQDIFMPVVRTPGLAGDVLGRLRDGATLQEARVELDTINRRLQTADPATDRAAAISVQTYSQAYVGPDAPMIYGSLWAGAWFVLLIACANVTNLTLVRTTGQWRDFSTRIALGAGVGRITRQMVMESLMLASVACALGWWITQWSVPRWATATASRYLALDYTVDSGILLYAVAISLVAAMLYSIAPVGRIVRLGASGALKSDARGVTQGLRGKRIGAMLVATQMALSIVLLSGAGVLVRSLLKIVNAETGVRDPEHLLVGSLRLPSNEYATPAARLAYFDRLNAQLRTIPGIADVSVASHIPVNWVASAAFEIEGKPIDGGGSSAQFLTAGSNYFRVIGAPPAAGRDFNDGDALAALRVAIVNQSFVERFLPGETAVGRRLRRTIQNQPGEWLTVVGVVPNIMQVPSGNDQTRQHFTPLVYVPFRQQPMMSAVNNAGQGVTGANVLLRVSVPFSQMAQAIDAAVRNTEPDARLEDLTTLRANVAFDRDRMDLQHAELGKHAAASPVFAAVALMLSAIGLSGVIAHSVSQRTKEIGVRMAIGAAVEDIRRMILREGLTPVVIGIIAGLTTSLAVNRVLQSQLVGISPYDPVTMTGAPAILILVALLACEIPARRAMNIDPSIALRHD